ncbi:MAG: FprA family A-type flavoprotein [Ruminococcaceae bacterium]|nr:FprA family A-type flavoprotein [Oscillospiraceae bacterium]
MKITNDIIYVGVNDHEVDLFEGQYRVPNGIAYNSYVIIDDKVAIMDTVDARFTNAWLTNIREVLGDRAPDYLVIQHMEPDHSSSITALLAAYPEVVLVASAKAFGMMKGFYGVVQGERHRAVNEGDTLALGKHTLQFYTAPMVHWPEVIVSYDIADRVLFSADAFGKFGALDVSDEWVTEARRYYIGIVGKYGAQVTALLKKLSVLDVSIICPLHGPVLTEDLASYISLYATWASYGVEKEGVVIAYTSVYGHTKQAAEQLGELLRKKGCQVELYDLARADMSAAVAAAFCYSKLVLATTTYNAEIFPPMREFIHHLIERNFRARTVALIENGSWMPTAAKHMRAMLEPCRDLTFTETSVKILSALNEESEAALQALAEELA